MENVQPPPLFFSPCHINDIAMRWHSWLPLLCMHYQAVIDNFGMQVGTQGQTAGHNPTGSHTEFVI